MGGGLQRCSACGCFVADLTTHVCNEIVLHAKETADLQREFTSVKSEAAFAWQAFDRWISTPAGRFADYLAQH